MSRLVFILVLSGCYITDSAEWTPGIEYATNEELPNQANALRLALLRVSEETSLDMHGVRVNVYWTTTNCPGTDETAVIYKDRCYDGLTFNCSNIFVAARGTIGASAFVHELGHCFLLWNELDGDADHSNDWLWDTMVDIRREVNENGW